MIKERAGRSFKKEESHTVIVSEKGMNKPTGALRTKIVYLYIKYNLVWPGPPLIPSLCTAFGRQHFWKLAEFSTKA